MTKIDFLIQVSLLYEPEGGRIYHVVVVVVAIREVFQKKGNFLKTPKQVKSVKTAKNE